MGDKTARDILDVFRQAEWILFLDETDTTKAIQKRLDHALTSLKDMVLGLKKEEYETCTKCGGIGRTPNHPHIEAKRCSRCDGTGKILRNDYRIFNKAIEEAAGLFEVKK